MLTRDEAMALAGVSSRTVSEWVESREIHFVEIPEGFLLICSNSLPPEEVENHQSTVARRMECSSSDPGTSQDV